MCGLYASLWAVVTTGAALVTSTAAAGASSHMSGAPDASTKAASCLHFAPSQVVACHNRSDGSFTISRQSSSASSEAPLQAYTAATALAGCNMVVGSAELTMSTQVVHLAGQRQASAKMLLHASKHMLCPGGMEATIVDTLMNETDGSLRWDIQVSSSSSGFWTAPITSTVSFPGHTDDMQYWFGGSTGGEIDLGPIDFGKCDSIRGDPKLPAGTCDFKFGGDYADPTTPPNEVWTNQLVLPIWSYYSSTSPRAGTGAVALVQSPLLQHAPVFARLQTYARQSVATFTYSRELSRLGNGTDPVLFSQQLLHTEADWRPAAGWMVDQFPEFFFPNRSANIARMEGAGAYADYRGTGVDAAYRTRLERMNFGINWDAGMYTLSQPCWCSTPCCVH